MPFINVKTNKQIADDVKVSIKSKLGTAITLIPGKSESWLMVGIEDSYDLWFKGTGDPAAMVEVSIYGSASADAMSALTGSITDILGGELSIPASRIYVKYTPTDYWGWNGSNF